jgi:hypothetical protein
MNDAFELAGYFGAHAIWCVADAETLIPMLAAQRRDGSMHMDRFEGAELSTAVESAREQVELNDSDSLCAALLYDGYITLPQGKTDAVIMEIVEYASGHRGVVAVPYRTASDPAGFAVYRPKFLKLPDSFQFQALGEAFFRGVDRHEKGAAVWSKHLDETR